VSLATCPPYDARLPATLRPGAALTVITVTARRTLGTGPEAPPQNIRAAQTGLLDTLPGVHLPDLGELRARGVLKAHPSTAEPATIPRRRPHGRHGVGSLRPAPGGVDDGGPPLCSSLCHLLS
jgi:hypothetical protein